MVPGVSEPVKLKKKEKKKFTYLFYPVTGNERIFLLVKCHSYVARADVFDVFSNFTIGSENIVAKQ